MIDTGIVRRLDDLGRIVIPTELRKKLNIKVGDSMQIFVDKNNIILNKYCPFNNYNDTRKKVRHWNF